MIHTEVKQGEVLFQVKGNLEAKEAEELKRELTACLKANPIKVVIDLGQVRFMDVFGAQALLAFCITCKSKSIEIGFRGAEHDAVAPPLRQLGMWEKLSPCFVS